MAFVEQRGTAWCAAVWLALAGVASAQDSPLLSAPIEYTDVIDAFDGDDPIDIQARIEFRSTYRSGTIQREVITADTGEGSNESRYRDLLEQSGVRNELQLGLDVGVWRDLMIFVGLPIVLSDDEELLLIGGSGSCDDEGSTCSAIQEVPADGGGKQLLFVADPRLVSKQRSGLPRVDLGIAFALFNQFRGTDATWVLRAMLSVPTGEARRACISEETCAPGLSDGVLWLTLESRWSRRYRYVEPLLGISHRFGWVTLGEQVYSTSLGSNAQSLPTTTEATAGAALVPWEDRMRHQRFSIELLGRAAYISQGRGMSELFDALGTSMNTQLIPARAAGDGGFTGVTTIGAHGRLGADLMLVMKAARYVRFTLGTELGVLTDHLLTGAKDCDASAPRDESMELASPCYESQISPLYRPVIDAPGQRFRLADAFSVGLVARAQGQF